MSLIGEEDWEIKADMRIINKWRENLEGTILRRSTYSTNEWIVRLDNETREEAMTEWFIKNGYKPLSRKGKRDPKNCSHEWRDVQIFMDVYRNCKYCEMKHEDWLNGAGAKKEPLFGWRGGYE